MNPGRTMTGCPSPFGAWARNTLQLTPSNVASKSTRGNSNRELKSAGRPDEGWDDAKVGGDSIATSPLRELSESASTSAAIFTARLSLVCNLSLANVPDRVNRMLRCNTHNLVATGLTNQSTQLASIVFRFNLTSTPTAANLRCDFLSEAVHWRTIVSVAAWIQRVKIMSDKGGIQTWPPTSCSAR